MSAEATIQQGVEGWPAILLGISIPLFMLALAAELLVDRFRKTGHYGAQDLLANLCVSVVSMTTAHFTKALPLAIWGFVLHRWALFEIPVAWFDLSLRGVALWVAVILLSDFLHYWGHRLSHELPILWATHAVHHQSERYNLSVALRQTSTGNFVVGAFFLPLFVLGVPLSVALAANVFIVLYQFWVHSAFIGGLGGLDRILVTPANHRLHHARNDAYLDTNYGGFLIVWDRLFGTYAEAKDDATIRYGTHKGLSSWNAFYANFDVFSDLSIALRRATGWHDRWQICFGSTNSGPSVPRKSSIGREKPLGAYPVVQVAFGLVLMLAVGGWAAEGRFIEVLIPSIALWALLYGVGLMQDGRHREARRFERIRLLLLNPALAVGFVCVASAGKPWLVTTVVVYGLASTFAFEGELVSKWAGLMLRRLAGEPS